MHRMCRRHFAQFLAFVPAYSHEPSCSEIEDIALLWKRLHILLQRICQIPKFIRIVIVYFRRFLTWMVARLNVLACESWDCFDFERASDNVDNLRPQNFDYEPPSSVVVMLHVIPKVSSTFYIENLVKLLPCLLPFQCARKKRARGRERERKFKVTFQCWVRVKMIITHLPLCILLMWTLSFCGWQNFLPQKSHNGRALCGFALQPYVRCISR